jgi:hypothetical protein
MGEGRRGREEGVGKLRCSSNPTNKNLREGLKILAVNEWDHRGRFHFYVTNLSFKHQIKLKLTVISPSLLPFTQCFCICRFKQIYLRKHSE